MKLCKIGQSCPTKRRRISKIWKNCQSFPLCFAVFHYAVFILCSFLLFGISLSSFHTTLRYFVVFIPLCGIFHFLVFHFVVFILLCCTLRYVTSRFSYYFAVLIFKLCRIGQSCPAKRKRILKLCKRSILKIFW